MRADEPLSAEQLQQLGEAKDRAAGIHAAARVATFNAWSLGIFAGITALFGLTRIPTLALAVALGVVARNEWRGRAMLRRFDPSGPTLLSRNQLGLLTLVVAYCSWQLVALYVRPNPEWAQLQELLELEPDYFRNLVATGYTVAALVAGPLVGLNARYYARRGPMIADYLRETPDWVLAVQRASSPG